MKTDTTQELETVNALCGAGQMQAAREMLDRILRCSPEDFGAWLLLAKWYLQVGHSEPALHAASTAVQLDPANPDALYVLGRVHKARGEHEAAEVRYRQALRVQPDNADVLTSLGLLVRSAGRPDEAVALYRRALEIKPDHALAARNLRNALTAAGVGDCVHWTGQGLVVSMQLEQRLRGRASGLAKLGQSSDALLALRIALQFAPTTASLWLDAGLLALEIGLLPTALAYFEQCCQLDPSCYQAVDLARRICIGAGLRERALKWSDIAARLAPGLAPGSERQIARRLILDAIQPSGEAIALARTEYEQGLDAALQCGWQPADPYNVLQLPTFYLAYHGENDRDLLVMTARMCLRAIPDLTMTAAHCQRRTRRPGRIRIGFISKYLWAHSIGKTTRGLIEKLDRERFEVYALRITPCVDDATTQQIRRAADHTVTLDNSVPGAREQIAALELDVLFYQDIGMEPTSGFLAFARLAPVQCVSFGHPNTTGIPNMDYFVSNDLFETDEAPSHYSEQLVLLHDLPTLAYYYKPTLPVAPPSRARFGLPDDAIVYLCPQTLFKIHPDFDRLVHGILRGDPTGVAVFIRGDFDEWTEALQRRFGTVMPEVAHRTRFLPHMDLGRFLELLAVADVVLDPVHFNGMNSSLESFAVGTPVVTLPTKFQRGRHTQAMYRKMGIPDCIAQDADHYVNIAVRLGTDKAHAQGVRERILASNHLLFEDIRVVREFERFFAEAVSARYGVSVPRISAL